MIKEKIIEILKEYFEIDSIGKIWGVIEAYECADGIAEEIHKLLEEEIRKLLEEEFNKGFAAGVISQRDGI